jgi:hypothetical protein
VLREVVRGGGRGKGDHLFAMAKKWGRSVV